MPGKMGPLDLPTGNANEEILRRMGRGNFPRLPHCWETKLGEFSLWQERVGDRHTHFFFSQKNRTSLKMRS